jgi:hypothetical protein
MLQTLYTQSCSFAFYRICNLMKSSFVKDLQLHKISEAAQVRAVNILLHKSPQFKRPLFLPLLLSL